MTVLKTQSCAKHGHPEFALWCDDGTTVDALTFPRYLESAVTKGEAFRPGETLQWGWVILKLELMDDAALTLLEPDMSGQQGRASRSITRTLLHTRRQHAVAESLNLVNQLAFPSHRQKAIACDRYGPAQGLQMSRIQAPKDDSGWFFGCMNQDHDHQAPANLNGASLYELACVNPDTIDYLALPTGSVVLLKASGAFQAAYDGQGMPLTPNAGSYLHQKSLRDWSA